MLKIKSDRDSSTIRAMPLPFIILSKPFIVSSLWTAPVGRCGDIKTMARVRFVILFSRSSRSICQFVSADRAKLCRSMSRKHATSSIAGAHGVGTSISPLRDEKTLRR